MTDKEKELIEQYQTYFFPYAERYTTAEQQASEFRIVSILQNVETNENINSIILPQK